METKPILILAPDTRTETELLGALIRVLRVLNLLFYFLAAVRELSARRSFQTAFQITRLVLSFVNSFGEFYDAITEINADAATLARLQIVTRARPEITNQTKL